MRRNQGENDLQRQKETSDLASAEIVSSASEIVAAASSLSIGTHNTCLTRKKGDLASIALMLISTGICVSKSVKIVTEKRAK